jgi:hemerythrin
VLTSSPLTIGTKKLVTPVNKLNDAVRAGKGQQIMGNNLDQLIDYTKTHFATEEQLMLIYMYPGSWFIRKSMTV